MNAREALILFEDGQISIGEYEMIVTGKQPSRTVRTLGDCRNDFKINYDDLYWQDEQREK